MGISVRRRVRRAGLYTDYISVPKPVLCGAEATIAVNRILIADPRGEIQESDLLEFLETYIEPRFWQWWEEKRKTQEKGEADGANQE